jgi:succinyl-CoA synthetase alpha subunit
MSILVDHQTRLLVQGIAEPESQAYVEHMVAAGSPIVAGVTFGQGGTWHGSLPVFDTVKEAVQATDANATVVCGRGSEAPEAILEAADSGLGLIVCMPAEVPVHDMVQVKAHLRGTPIRLIGPGSSGVCSPGKCNVGITPGYIVRPGPVGIVSRSGSLTYEVTWLLTQAGLGQSTILSIGGGMVVGSGLTDVLAMFEDDPTTEQVVLIGEIGGREEEMAARFVADRMSKPVVALVTGHTAPPGRQMGHAAAVIEEFSGTAQYKTEVLQRAGVRVARYADELPSLLKERV